MKKYCLYCMEPLDEGSAHCPHCSKDISYTAPSHHISPGEILNKKYMVGAALGEGGFGITYIGRDLTLDMRVAIKEYFPNGYVSRNNEYSNTLSESNTQDRKEFFDSGLERFLKEARILARFSGEPGIVDVRDFFEENNTAYIVMEFLDGKTLKQLLSENGKLERETVMNLLTPVMVSLKEIHKQGLIHRDISPDNIMIMGKNAKLLDFGAARNISAIANKSLSVMLKPGYAPEEQYRSRGDQGSWTDVYAISATIYKCITGVTPDDAAQRVYADEVKTPSEFGINVSSDFEKALMKGMAVFQRNRYSSIDELINGLNDEETRSNENEDDKKTVYISNTAASVSEDDIATCYLESLSDPEDLKKTEYLSSPEHLQQTGPVKQAIPEPESQSVCTQKKENNISSGNLESSGSSEDDIATCYLENSSDPEDSIKTEYLSSPEPLQQTEPVKQTASAPNETPVYGSYRFAYCKAPSVPNEPTSTSGTSYSAPSGTARTSNISPSATQRTASVSNFASSAASSAQKTASSQSSTASSAQRTADALKSMYSTAQSASITQRSSSAESARKAKSSHRAKGFSIFFFIIALLGFVFFIISYILDSAKSTPNNNSNLNESFVVAAPTTVTNVPYTYYGKSGTYTGEWSNNMPYGNGTFTYDNGNVYSGEWWTGKPSGQGTLTYANGDVYEGKFTIGELNQGTLTYANGDVYTGGFLMGVPNDEGTLTYANGDVYEGEWQFGKRYGQGSFIWDHGEVYEGEWKNDMRNGQGTLTWPNGDKYVGEWKDNLSSGQGTLTLANGNVYKGAFKDSMKNGQGTFTWSNGDVYEGEWKDNMKNGQGTLTKGDGTVIEGEWKDDEYVGGF